MDRLFDAWLQHRAAARRRAHSLHGLACDLLVQRRAHAHGHCRSGAHKLGRGTCLRDPKSPRGLDRLCFAGHVDGVAGFCAACIAACKDGTASRYWPVRTGGGGVLAAADRGVARQGAARRPELLRAAQLRHGRRHRLAVDVQHLGPAALLQPLCAEPGRTGPFGAGGRRLPAAAERGPACTRPVRFRGGGAPRAAQCHAGRHGADRDRQCRDRRGHRRGRDGAPGDRVFCDGRRSGRALCLGAAAGAVGARAHASGAGVRDHQRLHLSRRQLRRRGRRHCVGAGGISRRADDDCATGIIGAALGHWISETA